MRPRADKAARGIGLLLGVFVAATAVWSWHIPRGNGTLGAQVIVTTMPTGEIEVSPPGELLSAPSLRPAPITEAQSGRVKVRNITPRTLSIGLKATPSSADLNSLLWLQVDANGHQVFRGTLDALQAGVAKLLVLHPQEAANLDVSTWLPPDTGSGYEGRIQALSLEFPTKVQGAKP